MVVERVIDRLEVGKQMGDFDLCDWSLAQEDLASRVQCMGKMAVILMV